MITDAHSPAFTAQMRRLLGLKFVPADMQTHWEALRDLPEHELAAAVSQAQKVCVDFPTPFELHGFAAFARSQAPLPPVVDRSEPREEGPFVIRAPAQFGGQILVTGERVWSYYCEDCSDTGTRAFWCGMPSTRQPWLSRRNCGRASCFYDHDWSEPCVCVPTNPDVQRKIAARQQEPLAGRGRR